MTYTLVSGSNVYPSTLSYQTITLVNNIVLDWPSSFGGGIAAAGFNKVVPDQSGWTITLPDATLASDGTDVIFDNVTLFTFNVLDNGGNLLYTLNPGEIINFKLDDSSTALGVWLIIPFGGGYNGVVAFDIESSDNSVNIANGNVTAPGGTVDVTLSNSLSNLDAVITTGLAVITDNNPLTWKTTEILSGTNILVTDGDGVLANPIINVDSNVIGLDSLEVGNFSLAGSNFSALGLNSDLTFSTNGTGLLNFNGVTVGTSADMTCTSFAVGNFFISSSELSAIANDSDLTFSTNGTGSLDLNGVIIDSSGAMTIAGGFSDPAVAKSWCVFTDISSTIVIEDQVNVSSIVRITDSSASYEIFFTTPMADINYGVTISLGTNGGSSPFVSHGFWTTRGLSSVIITIADAAGQLVADVPYGATITIMQSS